MYIYQTEINDFIHITAHFNYFILVLLLIYVSFVFKSKTHGTDDM